MVRALCQQEERHLGTLTSLRKRAAHQGRSNGRGTSAPGSAPTRAAHALQRTCAATSHTSSLAATSPTLLVAEKWVWMTRKQGRPMPLAMDLASVPLPASSTNWAAGRKNTGPGSAPQRLACRGQGPGGPDLACRRPASSSPAPAAAPCAWQACCAGPLRRGAAASPARTREDLGGDLQRQAQRADALGHHAPAPRVLIKHCEGNLQCRVAGCRQQRQAGGRRAVARGALAAGQRRRAHRGMRRRIPRPPARPKWWATRHPRRCCCCGDSGGCYAAGPQRRTRGEAAAHDEPAGGPQPVLCDPLDGR